MQREESRAVSIPCIGGKDVMPITGYFGPYIPAQNRKGPDFITDEIFRLISESGINAISYVPLDYAKSPDKVKEYLDLGDKHGIAIFVTDSAVTDKVDDDIVTKDDVIKELEHYYEHPAFGGMYVVDEPDAPYYRRTARKRVVSDYGNLTKILQQDLNILCYSNLLPCTRYPQECEIYEQYVKEFYETFKPTVLMWDYYVYGEYGSKEGYFWNMDVIRNYAKKYNIPFWAFIQVGGQWHKIDDYAKGDLFPNEGEFNWNVNTSLAFGAQGIQYFPLIQPGSFAYALSEEGEFARNGIIGANGQINQWYYYAQKINKHIAAIDEVLMHAVHKGVIAGGEQAKKDMKVIHCMIESEEFEELQSITGNAMVGCFNYNGKMALYVVNYSTTSEQDITLHFKEQLKFKVIRNAESSCENTERMTLHMDAGEGILIVAEYPYTETTR